MRYFVIGDDGQKYGPADLDTLNSWIGESRLLPTQQLEEETSGVRMAASAVQGLNFPAQSTQQFAPGQPYQQHYGRPTYVGDDGSKELKNAWICFVFSVICLCGILGPVFSIFTILNANKALAKGNQAASAPKVLGIIALVLTSLILVGQIVYQVMARF